MGRVADPDAPLSDPVHESLRDRQILAQTQTVRKMSVRPATASGLNATRNLRPIGSLFSLGVLEAEHWPRIIQRTADAGTEDVEALGVLPALPLPGPYGVAQDFAGRGGLAGRDALAHRLKLLERHGDADLLRRLHV